ncbi:MAG TPA: hypothetical protein DCF63_08675, partial [Planctomycetaceae bacterium]|nr:hypothetical protein [Planctomycetaceae bacterium]
MRHRYFRAFPNEFCSVWLTTPCNELRLSIKTVSLPVDGMNSSCAAFWLSRPFAREFERDFKTMPAIQAFRGLRYNLARVGSLSNVVAPPYDVVDAQLQQHLYDQIGRASC